MMEFISVMFRAITGLKLTSETIVFLGFLFALGWLFGKLTRQIGIIKGIFLAIFGSVAFVFLSHASGVVVFAFMAGVLANHGPLLMRVVYWAQDIADIFYALQYRQAFEDIRAQEARMEEEMRRARADAYARAHARGDSAAQDRWRQASGRRSAGEKEKQDSGAKEQRRSSAQGSAAGAAPKKPKYDPARDRNLTLLGLEPGREHSPEDIKKAFRKRAKKTHPDVGGDGEEFKAIKAALDDLSSKGSGS